MFRKSTHKKKQQSLDAYLCRAQRKESPLNFFQKLVVALIIVAFLSSSLASIGALILNNNRQSTKATQATLSEEEVNTYYAEKLQNLETAAEAADASADTLRQVAQLYMMWGHELSNVQSTQVEARDGKYLKAREYLTRAVALEPSDQLKLELSYCAFYLRDLDGAIAEVQELLAANPEYIQAWQNLALYQEEAGKVSDARTSYEKLIALAQGDDKEALRTFAEGRIQRLNESLTSEQTSSTS